MSAEGNRSSGPRFAIGEVAIWIDTDEGPAEVTIIGPREFDAWYEVCGHTSGMDYGYAVRYRDGDTGFEPERYLRKKHPPRQDFGVVRWDECPWQPESIHA